MSREMPENVEEISLSSKTSTFHPPNVEEMTARKKMSMKTPENVEGISLSSKTSTFYPQNVEEMTTQKKMSWKTPENVEKPPPQKGAPHQRKGLPPWQSLVADSAAGIAATGAEFNLPVG